MAKPPLRTVASDDCEIEEDGVRYKIHEGEWIKVVSSFAVGTLHLMRKVSELQTRMASLEDNDEVRKVLLLDDTMSELVDVLQDRVVDWNWTDDVGKPLPKPYRNPDAFRALRIEELMYLAVTIKGEAPGETKNGSRPLPTTSSATRQARSRASSSGGRNR